MVLKTKKGNEVRYRDELTARRYVTPEDMGARMPTNTNELMNARGQAGTAEYRLDTRATVVKYRELEIRHSSNSPSGL